MLDPVDRVVRFTMISGKNLAARRLLAHRVVIAVAFLKSGI
ncbi:hypothetical protein ES703_62035 [subsurface metagenome]